MKYVIYDLIAEDFLYRQVNCVVRHSWGKLGNAAEKLEVLNPVMECVQHDTYDEELLLYYQLMDLSEEIRYHKKRVGSYEYIKEMISSFDINFIDINLDESVVVALIEDIPDFSISYNVLDLIHYGERRYGS